MARAAGVSRATVSYVLNDRRDVPVAEATRQQVIVAARELGYQPSPAARALRVGHGEVVLVLLPEWASMQFTDILAEVGSLIGRHGLVCLRHEGPQWQRNLGRLLGRVTAAAVITLEPLEPEDAAALQGTGVPEVRLWLLDNAAQRHNSAIDQFEVVRLQVEHLLERGYRRLAYLATESTPAQRFIEVRIQAFEQICRSHGIQRAPVAVEAEDLDAVVAAIRTWRRRSSRPLGICAWSDVTAIAALNAARVLELEVPGDLGVIGVDDTPSAQLVLPALSSVRLNLAQEAALTAHRVAAALGINGKAPATTDAAVVVARSST